LTFFKQQEEKEGRGLGGGRKGQERVGRKMGEREWMEGRKGGKNRKGKGWERKRGRWGEESIEGWW